MHLTSSLQPSPGWLWAASEEWRLCTKRISIK